MRNGEIIFFFDIYSSYHEVYTTFGRSIFKCFLTTRCMVFWNIYIITVYCGKVVCDHSYFQHPVMSLVAKFWPSLIFLMFSSECFLVEDMFYTNLFDLIWICTMTIDLVYVCEMLN